MLKTKKLPLLLHSTKKSVNNSYLNDHENIRGGSYYTKSDNKIRKIKTIKEKS